MYKWAMLPLLLFTFYQKNFRRFVIAKSMLCHSPQCYHCLSPKRQLQNSSELLIQVWNVKLNIYLSCWIDSNSWHPQKIATKLFPSHVWLREMPVCKIIRTVKSICAFAEYWEHIFIFLWRANTWYVFKNLIFFESKNV